ncbi:MAG: helix-turn-helix domain-containing protein [Nanoarchaeota archaeon]
MNNIRSALEKIGLTKGEIDVYLALLEIGLSTTGRITKEANISSSKVYEVLSRLVVKGLASYVIENGKYHYAATPAERLIDYLEEKKLELGSSQEAIRRILPRLEAKRKEHKMPEAVIYRGTQGPIIALRDILDQYRNGVKGSAGYGTDEDDYVKHFPAQLQEYFTEAKKYCVNERLLFARGFKSPNPYANIRYLPPEYLSPVRVMVCANKVYLVDFTKPMTTIIIEKQEIAEAYRKHFDFLWNIAKPIIKQFKSNPGNSGSLKSKRQNKKG